MNVSKWNYGKYRSSNYGSHTQAVSVGNLDLYFSYKTVVAFRCAKFGFVCSENVWSRTTGKHLNWIEPHKPNRVSYDTFTKMLNEVLEEHKLVV